MRALRIVVAEDETLVAVSIISQLKELGHTVVGDATDGQEAVELCEKLRPDLVIMDINMPRMDGIQAARLIGERVAVPVVVVSGYSEEELVTGAAEAGVGSYLVKPVTKHNLAPAIEVALQNHAQLCRAREEAENLKKALAERKLIERAKGILMDRHGLGEGEAMRRLQQMSNEQNKKLSETARMVIDAVELLS